MSEISPRLGLPYLMPSQAQKHVTHNEALTMLDVMVQTVITAFDAQTPPASPDPDQIFALGDAPTGDWAGAAGSLAQWAGSGWVLITPRTGWLAWGADGRGLVQWSGDQWRRVSDTLTRIGIGATPDDTNRLVVAAPASLLTHSGAGHQLKINKAAASETASVLFQSNWSGRAEIGLCGGDSLSVKLSADGSSFTEALTVTETTVTGAAVQSSPDDRSPGKLARADFTLARGDITGAVSETGGTPTGAIIERAQTPTGDYTKFADGTLICTRRAWAPDASGSIWTYPAPFATGQIPVITATASGQTTTPVITGSSAQSETAATLRAFTLAGTGISEAIDVLATGRWY